MGKMVNQVMYEMIVHTPREEELSHITMTCPSCGAVNRITVLEEGCPYCDSEYHMENKGWMIDDIRLIR